SVAQIVKIEGGKFVSATGEAPAEMKTFQVFPNPVTVGGSFSVEIRSNRTGQVNFELTDATGKAIRSYVFSEKPAGNQSYTFKISDLPTGVYFLSARLGAEVLGTGKVMLKN
ncbi:MAG TPA: T9SS type A sorting domain-containing protein, partial [Saprospiraceae bacterium]|nr:T9SS type A sorting domain-containing protein [Saprospiraceae bacterium]